MAKGRLSEIIIACIDIGLFYENEGYYFSKRLLTHKEFRQYLSEKGKEGAAKKWGGYRGANGIPYAKERKEKERKEKESIIQEEKKTFSMIQIYDKSWDEYKEILNGQAKHLNEELFKEWKEFVDFIYENEMTDLFSCKFLSPIDFGKMKKDVPFPRSEWLNILKKILSTGIKPEHILLYRIPEFIGYAKKGIYPQSAKSSYQEEVEAKRKNFKPTEA